MKEPNWRRWSLQWCISVRFWKRTGEVTEIGAGACKDDHGEEGLTDCGEGRLREIIGT